jgi:hypothetical protein
VLGARLTYSVSFDEALRVLRALPQGLRVTALVMLGKLHSLSNTDSDFEEWLLWETTPRNICEAMLWAQESRHNAE